MNSASYSEQQARESLLDCCRPPYEESESSIRSYLAMDNADLLCNWERKNFDILR